mmetsp:Transcript_2201/g.9528  ORF Transcript_2201/g.9528 Transcript_2201/m.9528 type:complete len:221 (-) Transcript_2201:1246-1908(-)|eukprot:scaffold285_cov304-Pinguiococcus_pyrenoidosus.AAC.33
MQHRPVVAHVRRSAGIREPSQRQRHHRQAEGPDVAARRVRLTDDALGAHVGVGPDEGLRLGHGVVQFPRQAEVAVLDIPQVIDQHVGRLDVPMHLAARVEEREAPEHLEANAGENLLILASSRLHDVLQGAAVHVLHDDRDHAVAGGHEGVVEGDDVRACLARRAGRRGVALGVVQGSQVLVQGVKLAHHLLPLRGLEDGYLLHGHQAQRRDVQRLVHRA